MAVNGEGPPQIFLTRGNLIGSEASNWLDCVQRIETHFNDVLFYRINRVLSGNKIIKPTYLEDARISRFDLDEETDYSLECLLLRPKGRDNSAFGKMRFRYSRD